MAAAWQGHLDVVQLLVQLKANPNIVRLSLLCPRKTTNQMPVLAEPVFNDTLLCASPPFARSRLIIVYPLLVRTALDACMQHNSEDVSALHCALANGHQGVVDWLLSLKAVQKLGEVQDILLLSNGEAPTRESVTCPFKALLPRPKLTTNK